MIDLTPLDVRKKRGDFRKLLRGYDPDEVDAFLDLVSERMEELVKQNLTLRERSERLQDQVSSQEGREKAVQDALVTAQQLRDEMRGQAQKEVEDLRLRTEREAKFILKQAEAESKRMVADAERRIEERRTALEEVERKRLRFLKAFRQLLQRELDMVEVEEGRKPLEEVAVELDLGRRASSEPEPGPPPERDQGRSPDDDIWETAPGEEDEEGWPQVDLSDEARELAARPGQERLERESAAAGAGAGAPFAEADSRPDPDAPVHELAREVPEGTGEAPTDASGEEASGEGSSSGSADATERPDLWFSSDLDEEPDRPAGGDGS